MIDKNDWRIMGQEGYLKNKRIIYKKFDAREGSSDVGAINYRQCEFCYSVCSNDEPGKLQEGYYEPISKSWICEECYQDFKDMFGWTVEKNVNE